MKYELEKRAAYAAGVRAFYADKPLSSCPYLWFGAFWRAGWKDASAGKAPNV